MRCCLSNGKHCLQMASSTITADSTCHVTAKHRIENYKTNSSPNEKIPEIEKMSVSNVLTLMAQAERDKMAAVLDECARFCHANLERVIVHHGSAIQTTLSGECVRKIAYLFHQNDADVIADRKNRIKSDIFRYLTERLLQPNAKPELGCPESAAHLFRCLTCSQLLTPKLASKMACHPAHVTLDVHGRLLPHHVRDEEWEVSDHVKDLYFRLRSWRRLYWVLWGSVHHLPCAKCKAVFPCRQMALCPYHPEAPRYGGGAGGVTNAPQLPVAPIGRYPCCQATACRFDPWETLSKGCRRRDHVVDLGHVAKDAILEGVYKDFLSHREFVCSETLVSKRPLTESSFDSTASDDAPCGSGTTNDLHNDATVAAATGTGSGTRLTRSQATTTTSSFSSTSLSAEVVKNADLEDGDDQPETESDTETDEPEADDDDDDDDDDEDYSGSNYETVTVNDVSVKPRLTTRRKSAFPVTWDKSRSRRSNQDVLRDFERKRFQEIVARITPSCHQQHHQVAFSAGVSCSSSSNSRVNPRSAVNAGGGGGLYATIEAQWRALHVTSAARHHQHLFPSANSAAAAAAAAARFSARKTSSSILAVAKFKRAGQRQDIP